MVSGRKLNVYASRSRAYILHGFHEVEAVQAGRDALLSTFPRVLRALAFFAGGAHVAAVGRQHAQTGFELQQLALSTNADNVAPRR